MDTYTAICVSIPNVVSMVFCVYLFLDSLKTSYKFYYQIISPFCSFVVFIIIFIRLLLMTGFDFVFAFWDNYPKEMRIITKIVDLVFLRNIENISIYTRIISIKEELQIYKKKVLKNSNPQLIKYKEYHSKKSKPGQKFSIDFVSYKSFIVQLMLLLILLFFCLFPLDDHPYIYSYFESINPKKIEDKSNNHNTYGGIVILVFNNLLYLYALLFTLQIFFLKIKEDTFSLQLEFNPLMLLILLENNITYIMGLSFSKEKKEYMFHIFDWTESLYSLAKILILYIVYRLRNNYTSKNKEIIEGTAHFEDFIMNNNCFQIFKYYSRHNQETLNYMAFYLDYIEFISLANDKTAKEKGMKLLYNKDHSTSKSLSCEKLMGQDETLVDKARDIFQNYFKSSGGDSSSLMSSTRKEMTSSLLKMSSQVDLDLSANYLIINFPIDIYDQVNNISKANFIVEHLETVFDDAYKWVLKELNAVYEVFKKEDIEMMKVQIILFFSDYFDELILDEYTQGRKFSDSISDRLLPSSNLSGNF
ncbi:MAG: hypothetical protein MJ252_12060 [archaeon]|nr:hypothetical protein [archaeon]